MAYSPTTWIALVTSLGPTNLNKLESGLQVAASVADAAIPKPGAPTDRDVLFYDTGTSSWKTGKLTAAMVAAGAGILKSQLAALAIADADVAVGAAINPNKIAAGLLGSQIQFSKSATPPGSPADGDLWLLPADATAGVEWLFKYNAGSASANKWEFIGGPPLISTVLTLQNTVSATYADLATVGPSVVIPRAGDYDVDWSLYAQGVGTSQAFVALNGAGLTNADPHVVNAGLTMFPRAHSITALTAGTLKMSYHSDSGSPSSNYQWRALSVLPVRVT